MEQSNNHLGLKSQNQLDQQQRIQALLLQNEKIIFCVNIWKYNKDGKCQQRMLVLTNHSLLNIVKNQNIFKSFIKKFVQFQDNYEVKRRIQLAALYGITISPTRTSNVFLIHVINDRDYYYKAVKNKLSILQMISEEYRRVAKKELAFYFRDQTVILNYCTFKNHIKDKKDPKPKQRPRFLNNDYFMETQFEDLQYICQYLAQDETKNILPKNFVRIDINQLKKNAKYFVLKQETNRSIHLSSFVQNPNILKPEFCFFSQKKELMFIPFMVGGCFKNYIDMYTPLSKENLLFYVSQIILILEKLRSQNKYYGNLALQHIFVKNNGYLVLSGFQKLSQLKESKDAKMLSFKISGNPLYFSPQIVSCQGIEKDLDVWRLGVCCYYLWKGKFPFEGKNVKQIYYRILQQQIQEPDMPDFIRQLLQKNKKYRLKFQQLKKHRDLSGVNWKKLEQQTIKAPFVVNIQSWSGKLPNIYKLQL